MDEKTAAALREAFPPELVGKRPQLRCRACSDSRTRNCDDHRKVHCDECGQWISSAHIHLDFVGHADITDRFLKVDPNWSWEPVTRAIEPQVLAAAVATGNPEVVKAVLDAAPPKFDSNGGFWLRLTIAGVTRLGYGDAGGKSGPNAIKEAIGDGLRNAGMRFGAGLDMWRKEPPETADSVTPPASGSQRTDHDWLTDIERRINAAESAQELQSLANEVEAKRIVGGCEQVHYDHLYAVGRMREQYLLGHPPTSNGGQPGTAPEVSPADAADSAATFEERLTNARTPGDLEQVRRDVMAAFKAQQLDPTTGNKLLKAIKARQAELESSAA